MKQELSIEEALRAHVEGKDVHYGTRCRWYAEVSSGPNNHLPWNMGAFLTGPRWLEIPDEKPAPAEPEVELPDGVALEPLLHQDGKLFNWQVQVNEALTALYRALMGEIQALGGRIDTSDHTTRVCMNSYVDCINKVEQRLSAIEAKHGK